VPDDKSDGVLDRLIEALAAQVASSERHALSAGAAKALADLSRSEVSLLFGSADHLAHYGTEHDSLQVLARLISNIQRREAGSTAALSPGDEVRLIGELPPSMSAYDETWVRQTAFVVRYVGHDGTIDVQPAWTEDYVIETVPAAIVRPTRQDH
jgi:hypothetical protein